METNVQHFGQSANIPAVKSRIEKLKDKFNVANAVALIGIVTELGI